MTRSIILIFMIGFCFSSCQPDSTNSADAKVDTSAAPSSDSGKKQAVESKSTTTANRLLKGKEGNAELSKILTLIGTMSGSSMLESVDYTNGQLTLKYFETASAFNTANGSSRVALDDDAFSRYWTAGSRYEKVISSIPPEMLHKFNFIKNVTTSLSTGKKNITSEITREKLSQLTGNSWEDMNKDWTSFYTNSIVRIPEGRAKFIKQLTK